MKSSFETPQSRSSHIAPHADFRDGDCFCLSVVVVSPSGPPIPTTIEFSVVVPEDLADKVVGLNVGDACVLVYPENTGADNLVSLVDILVK